VVDAVGGDGAHGWQIRDFGAVRQAQNWDFFQDSVLLSRFLHGQLIFGDSCGSGLWLKKISLRL
jgi:hypothetical protein